MAKNSEFTGIRSDPGDIVSATERFVPVPTKSFIVGRYDEEGRSKVKGEAASGSEEGNRLKNLMVRSMSTRGGELLPGFVMTNLGPRRMVQPNIQSPIKGKRGRPKAVKPKQAAANQVEIYEEPVYALPEPEVSQAKAPTFSIVFLLDHGKIKARVDCILEDPTSLALVFKDEDTVSYVPEKGNKLKIMLPDKREIEVLYLGIQLQWYNTSQQILVFMKTESTEE